MDLQNLCVGDWVMDNDPTFYTKVTPDMIWEGYEWEPVTLTKEILELNGWKQCDFAHLMTLFVNEKFTCLEWAFTNKMLFINDGRIPKPIQYVHELQQALRLCGLNELADNFKIK